MSLFGVTLKDIVNSLWRACGGTYVLDVTTSETAVNVQLPPEAQKSADKLDLTLRIKVEGNKLANVHFNLKDTAILGSLTVHNEGAGGGSSGGGVSIQCGDVGRDLTTSQGTVTCGNVGGNVKTSQGSIHCATVDGSATTSQGSITVSGDIGGDCRTSQGNVTCMGQRKRKAEVVDDEDYNASAEERKPKAKRAKK